MTFVSCVSTRYYRVQSMPGLNITGIAHQTSQHNIECKSADLIFYHGITNEIFATAIDQFVYESICGRIHLLNMTCKLIRPQSELNGNDTFG